MDLVILDAKGNRYILVPDISVEKCSTGTINISELEKNKRNNTTQQAAAELHIDLSFGQKLKKLRVEEKLTQAQMQTESKIKQSNISSIERGTREARTGTQEVLIAAWEKLSSKVWPLE